MPEPIDLLRRLRDEVYDCYSSSTTTEVRHAMLVSVGVTPQAVTEWWGVLADKMGVEAPIGAQFSWHRQWAPPGPFLLVRHHFFGKVSGPGELRRFEDQAGRLIRPALDCLGAKWEPYSPLDETAASWLTLCYFLAWDYPRHVTYKVTAFAETDSFHEDLFGGPVNGREAFEAWLNGRLALPDGNYALYISSDIRVATVEAIDAVIALRQGDGDRPGPPTEDERLATELWGRKPKAAPVQARLVDFMATRRVASKADVAREVHKNGQTSDDAIQKNCDRVNTVAAEIGSNLRYHLRRDRVEKEVQ